MAAEDRSDELALSLAGFHRCWVAYVGIELGLFDRLREAGSEGLTASRLAAAAGCVTEPVAAWLRAAYAMELLERDGNRFRLEPDLAVVLLDDERAEFLGGQIASAVVSTLDYDRLTEYFRTGMPIPERPPRFHRAIQRVTAQDITVFFQEGLAALPELTNDLARGIRVLDVACGGARWLTAVARRFEATRLVGVEFEPDSVARAMRHVHELGLTDRIRIEARDIADMAFGPDFDFVYVQDALHELPDPVGGLRASWSAVAPGGRLMVLEWCLPDDAEEDRTLQGQLLWAIQLDELYQGTRMYTLDGFREIYDRAGVPPPTVIELQSGATLLVTMREASASA